MWITPSVAGSFHLTGEGRLSDMVQRLLSALTAVDGKAKNVLHVEGSCSCWSLVAFKALMTDKMSVSKSLKAG